MRVRLLFRAFAKQLEVDAIIVNRVLKADFSGINKWGLDMDDWNIFVNSYVFSHNVRFKEKTEHSV
ncbi:hypothetical protein [Brevibacillus sp. SIMBA_040]|uniref:hypothetical protein n=1 Tax=unclassified Brevibacillus TaxID=2684853 RepID=UPI00397C710C